MFNNGGQFLFFPFEMGNFRLFQQASCEIIVNYANCNLLERELIRTGIRNLRLKLTKK